MSDPSARSEVPGHPPVSIVRIYQTPGFGAQPPLPLSLLVRSEAITQDYLLMDPLGNPRLVRARSFNNLQPVLPSSSPQVRPLAKPQASKHTPHLPAAKHTARHHPASASVVSRSINHRPKASSRPPRSFQAVPVGATWVITGGQGVTTPLMGIVRELVVSDGRGCE